MDPNNLHRDFPKDPNCVYRVGDILVDKDGDQFRVYKILKLEPEYGVFHLKLYQPVKKKPKIDEIDKLEVFIMHSPIADVGNVEVLGNIPVSIEELEGYFTYLKMTNFGRFLKETNQNPDDLIKHAEELYIEANLLADTKQFEEAIRRYSEAVQTFPLFWEALDNQGLCYMDLASFKEAIQCFEESLRINEENVVAIFSIGECYFRLGDFKRALLQFQLALEFDPEHQASREWLEKTERSLKRSREIDQVKMDPRGESLRK